jgi:UDP-GlcNAc:undecaprenyl-phosphate GlcNAc-1-phosphate transferase
LLATTVGHKTGVGEIVVQVWPVLAASFLVSLLATPICRRIAMKCRIVDRPDDFLKPHKKPIPYLGGVAIFLGWVVGIGVYLLWQRNAPEGFGANVPKMVGIALAGAATMAVGLFDDMRVMRPKPKLIANIAVALFLMALGIGSDLTPVLTQTMGVHFGPNERWLTLLYSAPVTLLVVVGACNATNLIDGLDGLCTGVLGIISLGYFILAAYLRHYTDDPIANERIVLALAMLGGAAGFLPFNRNPAKIFMGDAGSMLLGLNSAILMLLFSQDQINWILGAFMVFGLPIADMLLTLARRWRNGRPLMQGDRSHFYDQLIDRGLGVRRVVAISYLLTTVFVLVGISVMFLRIRHAILVYFAVVVAAVLVVWKLDMAGIERRPAGDTAAHPSEPSAHA